VSGIKTFLEYEIVVPLPRARSSVAAARSSGSGASCASRRAVARSRPRAACVVEAVTGIASNSRSRRVRFRMPPCAVIFHSAEEVFVGGPDDLRSVIARRRAITVASDDDGRNSVGLAHGKSGCRSEFVGDGEDRGVEWLTVQVAPTAQVEQRWHA